jgi:class 3 adenylate cyclase
MTTGDSAVHPPAMRWLAAGYARYGVEFIRRSLVLGQFLGGLSVAIGGPLLTGFFVPLTLSALWVLVPSAALVFFTDSVFAMVATKSRLRAAKGWMVDRDESGAADAWRAIAEIPFAPLRRGSVYGAVGGLIAGWGVVVTELLGLPWRASLLLIPGGMLFWCYWMAVRFFATEQLVRPLLVDISLSYPAAAHSHAVRLTLAQRLLFTVPLITVMAGAVVAGVVGDHTLRSAAIGVVVSVLVSVGVAGGPVLLLARSVTEPIADLRHAAGRIGDGRLEARVPVVSTDEIGSLAVSFNAMASGLLERERIRAALDTYVDRAVAEHILATGDESLAAGEDVEITALFLDVRGFTGYSENRSGREVVGMLNRLFDLVVPIVGAHGGHVDKFIGDGLLAVFGAPTRHPDHADRALAAALEIAALAADRPANEPRIGIGLNSGPVVAGNIGGAGRFDFTVIGDTVNVAARVEAATRHTGDTVLISAHTHALLQPTTRAATVSRPQVELKGKTAPVAVFAPPALSRADGRSAAPAVGPRAD